MAAKVLFVDQSIFDCVIVPLIKPENPLKMVNTLVFLLFILLDIKMAANSLVLELRKKSMIKRAGCY